MGRAHALLCLCALLAAGGVAASPVCVANPRHPFDAEMDMGSPGWVDLGACKTCDDKNATCVQCWEGFGVNSTGLCDRCEQYWCSTCSLGQDGKLSQCSDCSFDWEGESDVGHYAAANGTCVECETRGCMACTNVNATSTKSVCTRCNTELGLMPDATCQPCTDSDNCLWCNGDVNKCTECMSGFFLEDGICKPCSEGCRTCTNATACLECDYSARDSEQGLVLDPATATCVPCASEGCASCPTGPDGCEQCNTGYTNSTDGKACLKCSGEHCTTCAPGQPEVCTMCASSNAEGRLQWGVDSATGNCQANADACDWCDDGYWNDEKGGKCTPCGEVLDHCTGCSTDGMEGSPTLGQPLCDSCEEGWEVDPATAKCVQKKGGKA